MVSMSVTPHALSWCFGRGTSDQSLQRRVPGLKEGCNGGLLREGTLVRLSPNRDLVTVWGHLRL